MGRGIAAALCVLPLAFGGCREPTQITVELTTDVDCAGEVDTTVAVGTLSDVKDKPPVATKKGCKSGSGRIGSLVVVPSGENDDEVAIQVITGVSGQGAAGCNPAEPSASCIVARRALRFVPHTPLVLPIELSTSCLGKKCDPDQTCVDGQCVTAKLPDPEACTKPEGCGEKPDAGKDVTSDTGGDVAVDAGDGGNPFAQDLVASFDFEGATAGNVPDVSGHGATGFASSTPSAGVGRKGTTGLIVPLGDFGLGFQLSASVDQSTGATVAVWVNVKSVSASAYVFDHNIMTDPNDSPDDLESFLVTNPGDPSTLLFGADVTESPNWVHSSSFWGKKPIAMATWTHLVLTAGQGSSFTYVNGQQDGKGTVAPQFVLNKDAWFGAYWDGVIDDAQVYNRVLDPAEVLALHQSQL